ncbi:MAG: Holliday junction branch migration protein RuvA [Deltaproteobacteria bacterium]|nr:Holliday junction branch migration protein RuvA [Deltaproteobacteria bacterium]
MIAHINGILFKKTTQSLIIDNDGIGYEIIAPLSTFYSLPEEDNRVSLHIHTHVREDAFMLFGFKTLLEKEIFRMLISVSGIGPKLAINILSGIGPDELLEAMASGDALRLQSIPGVGKKTAERIALELRDKAIEVRPDLDVTFAQVKTGEDKKIVEDALSALLNLGYPARSAKSAVQKALSVIKDVNLEGLIKEALRLLA